MAIMVERDSAEALPARAWTRVWRGGDLVGSGVSLLAYGEKGRVGRAVSSVVCLRVVSR